MNVQIGLNRPLRVLRAPFEAQRNTLGSVPLARSAPNRLARALEARAGTVFSEGDRRECGGSRDGSEPGRSQAYLGGSKSMSLQSAEEWAGSAAGVLDAMTVGAARTGVLAQRSPSPALSTAPLVKSTLIKSTRMKSALIKNSSMTPSPLSPMTALKSTALRFTALGLPRPQQSFLPTLGEGTPSAGLVSRHLVPFLSERAHRPLVPNESIPPYAIFSSRSFRHWRVSL